LVALDRRLCARRTWSSGVPVVSCADEVTVPRVKSAVSSHRHPRVSRISSVDQCLTRGCD
jgi:hypothetical protein